MDAFGLTLEAIVLTLEGIGLHFRKTGSSLGSSWELLAPFLGASGPPNATGIAQISIFDVFL